MNDTLGTGTGAYRKGYHRKRFLSARFFHGQARKNATRGAATRAATAFDRILAHGNPGDTPLSYVPPNRMVKMIHAVGANRKDECGCWEYCVVDLLAGGRRRSQRIEPEGTRGMCHSYVHWQ